MRRLLRGFVGPWHVSYRGDRFSPWNHYRGVRRNFGESRRRAMRSTWMAYYVNWDEKQARP